MMKQLSIYIPYLQYGNVKRLASFFSAYGCTQLLPEPPTRSEIQSKPFLIVLPGVGSFHEAIVRYTQSGWSSFLQDANGRPNCLIIGICLGMHLLASKGCEGGYSDGLGLIDGYVEPLLPDEEPTKSKMTFMGWSSITNTSHTNLIMPSNITQVQQFYFCHSYKFSTSDKKVICSSTISMDDVAATICSNNVVGLQFHPELSQRNGRSYVDNLVSSFLNYP